MLGQHPCSHLMALVITQFHRLGHKENRARRELLSKSLPGAACLVLRTVKS